MSAIVLPVRIDTSNVERFGERAAAMANAPGWRHVAELGLRAARARDPYLLAALEKIAEAYDALRELRLGQTQRQASAAFADRVAPTVVNTWRGAYTSVDKGEPVPALQNYYGVAAEAAGLVR